MSEVSELVMSLTSSVVEENWLTKIQASVLMAGIMLDTKNFRTYKSDLMWRVTFRVAIVKLSRRSPRSFDEYREVNELTLTGEVILPHNTVSLKYH